MLSAASIGPAEAVAQALHLTNEFGHQLDMRRPDELVDRLNGDETIAAGDENAGIAREARGVARYGGEAGHAGPSERCRLRLGPDARRIEDDGAVAGELVGVERPALKVAHLGGHALGEPGTPRRLRDRRH